MKLKIFVHNVGHGQAIHAFTPSGEAIVIDLGCSEDFSPLNWLSKYNKVIEFLIVTHPHGDHIDEFLLLQRLGFKINAFWRPIWLKEMDIINQNQGQYSEKLDSYFEMSGRYYSVSPSINKVSGGVSITTFASHNCGVSNINNHSGVVVFEYHGVTVVIPGDNEPPSWRELMQQPKFAKSMKKANVFMASHHGRESGYLADIFEEKPNLCIVSDGRVQNTCARDRYTYHATGWDVQSRSSLSKTTRKCLTTRNDGYLYIEIGKNPNGESYLSVEAK